MKNILSVKISGLCFESPTKLDLFKGFNKDNEIIQKNYCVIYGNNGSGKTTISNAILNYNNVNNNDNAIIDFYDKENNIVNFPKENIHVYNEQYVKKNIEVTSDEGMNAIVRFGKEIEIDSQISDLNKEKEDYDNKLNVINIGKYEAKESKYNISEKYSQIKAALTRTYFEDIRKIRKKERKLIDDNVIKKLIYFEDFKITQKRLQDNYNINKDFLENNNKDNEPLNLIQIDFTNIQEENIYLTHLNKSFDKDQFNENAKNILQKINKNNSLYLNKTIEVLKNEDVCPLCFQKIEKEYASEVLKILNVIFNKEIEEEKSFLEKIYIKDLDEISLTQYATKIKKDVIENFEINYKNYNESIKNMNSYIRQKINIIHEPLNIYKIDLIEKMNKLKESIELINNDIKSYNENIKKYKLIEAETIDIRKKLAAYEVKTLADEYKKLLNDYGNDEKDVARYSKKIGEINEKIIELNSMKNNSNIALEKINKSLKTIFGTKSYMYLKPDAQGDKYNIFCNNVMVKKNKLSTGEKNIISLCYFFEEMKKGLSEEDEYKQNILLVIDDPISSFDYNNKLGVIDYLNKELKKIAKNNDSQIILMSHDKNISILLKEIFNTNNLGSKAISFELKNRNLIPIDLKIYNVYKTLLKEVYEYAINKNDNVAIINVMRRIIESYAKFNYDLDTNGFFQNNFCCNLIMDSELKLYFENRIFRYPFNFESHGYDVVSTFADKLDFDDFSDDDKHQLARETIILLYSIDKNHINKYLVNEPNFIANIETWIKKIKDSL